MHMPDLIQRKRDGKPLSAGEIEWMIRAYVADEIPDYQMSAFLMTVFFNGMTGEEIRIFTECMVRSGEQIDLSSIPGKKIDKHSTGGVGDKVSLILAPLVAAAGVPVPMMSGRGLGHTGGTLDKLEAIPGFTTQLGQDRFREILKQAGFAMIGQTPNIVPADRKLYALRDVTATVPSLPLICSSIISKKKAEGAEGLVLDVKFGSGSFLRDYDKTLDLAKALVHLGEDLGIQTVALLTNMEQPLGRAVGNWIETREAVESLRGEGPKDLMDVTFALGSLMLVLGGKAGSNKEAWRMLEELLKSGKALEKFIESVRLQGGDTRVIENPETVSLSPAGEVLASESGIIHGVDALSIGQASVLLGAGRTRKEDDVDAGAGILLHAKIGDAVQKGDALATFYTKREAVRDEVSVMIEKAFLIKQGSVDPPALIDKLVSKDGVRAFEF